MSERTPQHITTTADKFWLRFTRTLPTSEVGTEVSIAVMEKAMNRRRVGINVGICVLASFAAFTYGRKFSKDRKKQIVTLEDQHYK